MKKLKTLLNACPGISDKQKYVAITPRSKQKINQMMKHIYGTKVLVMELPEGVQRHFADLARLD